MKNTAILFSLVVFFFLATKVNAQIDLSKTLKTSTEDSAPESGQIQDLLKALDPGKSFTSPDKYMKLLSGNKDIVGKAMDVMKGSGTDSEKSSKLNILKSEHLDLVEKLLGKGKAAEYFKKIKPKIEPLAQKFALAKMFL